jgi:hypothetical protein
MKSVGVMGKDLGKQIGYEIKKERRRELDLYLYKAPIGVEDLEAFYYIGSSITGPSNILGGNWKKTYHLYQFDPEIIPTVWRQASTVFCEVRKSKPLALFFEARLRGARFGEAQGTLEEPWKGYAEIELSLCHPYTLARRELPPHLFDPIETK